MWVTRKGGYITDMTKGQRIQEVCLAVRRINQGREIQEVKQLQGLSVRGTMSHACMSAGVVKLPVHLVTIYTDNGPQDVPVAYCPQCSVLYIDIDYIV